MRLGLNGSTTNQNDIIQDIEVAGASGFDLLELRTYKLDTYLKNGRSLASLKEKFKKHNILPYAINALEFFTLKDTEEEKNKVLEEAEHWCEIASAINCPYLVVVPSRLKKDETEAEIIADAVQMLDKLAVIGEKHNVSIAFEFIGMEDFSVRTLELANKIIKEVNHEKVGLVVDTYHFHIGESTMESIQETEKDNIFIFHVNDAEKGIRKSELTDDHRIFPTLGSIPLENIGEGFKQIGYDKMISLEVFREEYWQMDRYELGKEAHQYMKIAASKMFLNKTELLSKNK